MSLTEQEARIKSTILIVDDDIAARDTLEELLAYEDYEIISAANGIEALKMARELRPDVILSDVMMPEMNGFEVCRRLRVDPVLAEVPIILITGLDDRDSFLKGLEAGADDFISKPFDRVKLSARVAAVARLNRYRRLLEERAKFERLIELSPDGILLIDSEGTIQMANPTIIRMLRMGDGRSLVGRRISAFACTQHSEEFLKFISDAFVSPENIYRTETRFVRMDDSKFPVEISAGHCALQSQPAVQLIVRDITERKAAEAEIRRAHEELTLACDTSLEGWSRALELRDRDTEGHSQRVTQMTLRLARAMNLPEEQLVHIRRGALLHDIGKMGIPDRILLKPGPLTEEEWVIMRKHPEYAYEMLSPIAYLRPALDIPHHHHERWDGTGYPCGLGGENIPLAARIFAVVDVWDALCSDRPYSSGWSTVAVREHILSLAGTHLDPNVVKIFMKLESISTDCELSRK
jgi:PAS domain S-box-containing protein/putative nucleotidyltransferase with HDIG domain